MEIGELEAQAAITHYRLVKFVKGIIHQKKLIDSELQNGRISEKKRSDLESAKYILDQQLQKIRFSGILDE